jgi:hypothetical protein
MDAPCQDEEGVVEEEHLLVVDWTVEAIMVPWEMAAVMPIALQVNPLLFCEAARTPTADEVSEAPS